MTTHEMKAEKSQFRLLLLLSMPFVIISLRIGYGLVMGEPFRLYSLVLFALTAFLLFLVIDIRTARLKFDNEFLVLERFFARKKVYLPALIKAERITAGYEFNTPRLKLQDQSGAILILDLGFFSSEDVRTLMSHMHPYIFITGVDKNFTDRALYPIEHKDIPKNSTKQMVRGSILYILLPCVILTLIVVVWAIVTDQPAFR